MKTYLKYLFVATVSIATIPTATFASSYSNNCFVAITNSTCQEENPGTHFYKQDGLGKCSPEVRSDNINTVCPVVSGKTLGKDQYGRDQYWAFSCERGCQVSNYPYNPTTYKCPEGSFKVDPSKTGLNSQADIDAKCLPIAPLVYKAADNVHQIWNQLANSGEGGWGGIKIDANSGKIEIGDANPACSLFNGGSFLTLLHDAATGQSSTQLSAGCYYSSSRLSMSDLESSLSAGKVVITNNVGASAQNATLTLDREKATLQNQDGSTISTNTFAPGKYEVSNSYGAPGGKIFNILSFTDGLSLSRKDGEANPERNLVQINDQGVALAGEDKPLITRGFDRFTSGSKNGLGRWGLFMEPHALVAGIPNMAGKWFVVGRYNQDGTKNDLLSINSEGETTFKLDQQPDSNPYNDPYYDSTLKFKKNLFEIFLTDDGDASDSMLISSDSTNLQNTLSISESQGKNENNFTQSINKTESIVGQFETPSNVEIKEYSTVNQQKNVIWTEVRKFQTNGTSWSALSTAINSDAFSISSSGGSTMGGGGSQLLTVLRNGNVGIGTTTPSTKLDVNGDIEANGLTLDKSNNSGNTNALIIDSTDNGNGGAYGIRATATNTVGNNESIAGYFWTVDNSAASGGTGRAIGVYGFARNNSGGKAYSIYAATPASGSERHAIFSEGSVYSQGAFNTEGALNTRVTNIDGGFLYAQGKEAGWFDGSHFSWGYGGTYNYFARPLTVGGTDAIPASGTLLQVNGDIRSSNRVFANGVQLSSDSRLKHDINNLKYGLGDLLKLRPVKYTWNSDNTDDIGFIAQEIKNIVPEIVKQDSEGIYSLDYSKLTSVIVNAIKELNAKVDSKVANLEKENAELKAKLDTLESRLEALEKKVK